MLSTLKREPVAVNERDIDEKFCHEVKSLLGYQQLAYHIEHAERARALTDVLREMNVKPFTGASVERYKRRMAGKMQLSKRVCLSLCAAGVVACVIDVPCAYLFEEALLLLVCVPAALLALFGAILSTHPEFNRETRQWHTTSLSKYMLPIPEFALQTALDIKSKLPGAEFYVEELRVEWRTADPFLVVCAGNSNYYIEVWNEPSYRQHREA